EEMCRAAEVAGRVLVTTCNKRYSPPYAEAARAIADGTVARPSLLSARFVLGYDYVDLLESGTVHLFDLARFLLGDVRRVWAAASACSRTSSVPFAAPRCARRRPVTDCARSSSWLRRTRASRAAARLSCRSTDRPERVVAGRPAVCAAARDELEQRGLRRRAI